MNPTWEMEEFLNQLKNKKTKKSSKKHRKGSSCPKNMKKNKCEKKKQCKYSNGKCTKRDTLTINGEQQEIGNTKDTNKLAQQLAILL